MLCYKDTITDTYYSLREVEQLDIFKQDKRKLVFNNSVYEIKLANTTVEKNLKKYVNPKIKKYAKQYLESRINAKTIEVNTFKK